jgi:hypothetical protein
MMKQLDVREQVLLASSLTAADHKPHEAKMCYLILILHGTCTVPVILDFFHAGEVNDETIRCVRASLAGFQLDRR